MIDIANIPYGRANAIPRPANSAEDRILRRAIEDANNNGDCIINTGTGYFRPDPNNKVDAHEFDVYMAKELHRARAIQKKRLSMKMTFERWREYGVLTNYTGTTGQP